MRKYISEDRDITFGEQLRTFRQELEISVAEVAIYLNKTEKRILEYETNVRLPTFEELWMLCLLFYCSLDSLCAPLLNNVFKNNEVATCLHKYVLYFNRFFYADSEYVESKDYRAILNILGYEIYPKSKIRYI